MRMAELNGSLECLSGAPCDGDVQELELGFKDIFDLAEIQEIQDSFAAATGVASIITDINGEPITRPSNFCHLCEHIIRKTPKGRANCYHSDAVIGRVCPDGPVMQPCLSGGLFDGGTSIMAGDQHIANWLIGQVRDPGVSEEVLLAYANDIGADMDEYRKALQGVTVMPKERFFKVCETLHLIGSQISKLAYKNVQQARLMAERRRLESQLRQAQKLEAIGQLAGGVAHDYNNILTAQIMQFDLLEQRDDLPPGVRDAISALHASAKSAASLTQQLLAFSRRQILQIQPLDLGELLSRMLKMMARMMRENIVLSFEPPLLPIHITADRTMIEQVFMNLLLNARDAIAADGRIDIFITRDNENKQACIEVRDSGCGMDEETRTRIFEPFFTTKEMGSGTGLGLATVYGIIQQHNGAIHIESTPGEGSSFHLRLPLAEENARKPTADVSKARELVLGQKQRILIVEDEAQVRTVLVFGLQRLGYEPIAAQDTEEALALWEKQKDQISAVLTDMVLPGPMTGLDLVRRLEADKPGLKVIIASGYSKELATVRATIHPSYIFLPKPYDLIQLSRILADVFASPLA